MSSLTINQTQPIPRESSCCNPAMVCAVPKVPVLGKKKHQKYLEISWPLFTAPTIITSNNHCRKKNNTYKSRTASSTCLRWVRSLWASKACFALPLSSDLRWNGRVSVGAAGWSPRVTVCLRACGHKSHKQRGEQEKEDSSGRGALMSCVALVG